jgi:uncharacterized membrane protein YsdA (DUF1294 family)
MLVVVVPCAIALCCFIIYALDRRSKGEPIVWESALKLTALGGILAGGVVFSLGTEGLQEVAVTLPTVTQDIFVGTPTF